MRDILITSDDALVFRDGRPFGDVGMRGGTPSQWPFPSTIAGAIRTATGFARAPDYFTGSSKAENIERILGLQLGFFVAAVETGEDWELIVPAPADATVIDRQQSTSNSDGPVGLEIHPLNFRKLNSGGTDLGVEEWLYPFPTSKVKPSSSSPSFWYWRNYVDWLNSPRITMVAANDLGTDGATRDSRIHVGIDPDKYTYKDGALFSTDGILLRTYDNRRIGFIVRTDGDDEQAENVSTLHLGGERRTAKVEAAPIQVPMAPDVGEQEFLRLILLTPGAFGGWKPEDISTEWSQWHGLPCRTRLRSAVVPGWTALSGWDVAAHGPKKMRKLVPAGSVYVIQLENPACAMDVCEALWLKSLCQIDSQEARDGFGIAAVGKATTGCGVS